MVLGVALRADRLLDGRLRDARIDGAGRQRRVGRQARALRVADAVSPRWKGQQQGEQAQKCAVQCVQGDVFDVHRFSPFPLTTSISRVASLSDRHNLLQSWKKMRGCQVKLYFRVNWLALLRIVR